MTTNTPQQPAPDGDQPPPPRPAIPTALAEVALIDGPTCAAVAGMGLSKWLDLVRQGKAPQPAIRQPRFSRWTAASVRDWLAERIKAGSLEGDVEATGRLIGHSKRASQAARQRRTAKKAASEVPR